MTQALKSLALLLLLLTAQQGGVVHELSHVHLRGHGGTEHRLDCDHAETICLMCAAFSQALVPAFSHAFPIPSTVRAAHERSADPLYIAVDAAVPRPRSRGPPFKT